jgi:excisionase family DNA binding protein
MANSLSSSPSGGSPHAAPASVEALLLSLAQTARATGLGRRKVWELCNSGELPIVRVGRRVLVPRAGLEAWIADRTEGGAR